MKVKKYRVLRDRFMGGTMYAAAGEIVYAAAKHDGGCANDDTRVFGHEHVSVSLKSDGDYPFFTIPVRDLQEVTE